MTLDLSPPTRRLVAIGLLLVAVALVWSLVAAPLIDARAEAVASMARLAPVIAHGRQAVRDIPALEAQLGQLKERGGQSARGLLAGTNVPIAAAQLQERLKAAADRVNGTLKSTQVLPARDDGGFRRVTVRAQLSVDLVGLQRVIYEMEAGLPYLFLDNVEIAQGQRPSKRAAEAAQDPLLDASFDLSGYIPKSQ